MTTWITDPLPKTGDLHMNIAIRQAFNTLKGFFPFQDLPGRSDPSKFDDLSASARLSQFEYI